jgi:ribonuclease Z
MKKTYFVKALIFVSLAYTSCDSDKLTYTAIKKQVSKESPFTKYFSNKESITVVTVGTSSPLPNERAQTGTAVIVNGHFFMFDVGYGVVQKIENNFIPIEKIDGIFLTHYHSDHIMDFANIISRSWQLGRKHDLNVYGPTGLTKLVKSAEGFLNIDKVLRVAHHGPEIMDTTYALPISNEFSINENSTKVIYNKDGIVITAFDVSHEPIEPAIGYCIEYKNKKVVISGDTKKNELLTKMSKDCDILVHEVMLMDFQKMLSKANKEIGNDRRAKIITDIQNYHTSAEEVAEIATTANVKKLVLNHLAPAPDNKRFKRMYMKQLEGFKGEKALAEDGDVFVIE